MTGCVTEGKTKARKDNKNNVIQLYDRKKWKKERKIGNESKKNNSRRVYVNNQKKISAADKTGRIRKSQEEEGADEEDGGEGWGN